MMNSYKENHKLTSDLDTRFKTGIVPHNKGKKCLNMHPNAIATQFQKGNIPGNHKPIGTETIDNKDGYIKIKVEEPNKWKYKHRMIWEQHYGKIPKNAKIMFLDGNKLNVSIENLEMITPAESLILNKNRLIFIDPELTKVGTKIAKLEVKIRLKKRGERNGKKQTT